MRLRTGLRCLSDLLRNPNCVLESLELLFQGLKALGEFDILSLGR